MKSDRERQAPYDITYMWNLKYDTNELIYKAETCRHTKQPMVTKGWCGGGKEVGV